MTHLVSQIPIFITVRGNTPEIAEKNKKCLLFSYLYIKQQNLFDQTYIISDNNDILNYSVKLGFNSNNIIYYPCGSQKDLKYLEYLATYRYGVEKNYHPDWIILLNVNQLFKAPNLISKCIKNIDTKFDIIASYTTISNRSHFFVETISNTENKNRLLSSEHQRVNMIDAAIYAIKTEFAFSCMEYDDPSIHFWSGKIKYFENDSVYTDIYSIKDIDKYKTVYDILDKLKDINLNKKK